MNFREKYKVQKTNIEKAYDYHLSLKNNKEYEQKVDNAFLATVNLFVKMYPNVSIEQPQVREKTAKSMKTKICLRFSGGKARAMPRCSA